MLPRKELDEFGNEIDPRKELVDRLLEYKRYKEVLGHLSELEDDRQLRINRGNIPIEHDILAKKHSNEMELSSVNLFVLLKVFQKVMDRYNNQPKVQEHAIVQYNYSIEEESFGVLSYVRGKKNVPFADVFNSCKDKYQAVFRFLSILDLIATQKVTLLVGEGINNFWLTSDQD